MRRGWLLAALVLMGAGATQAATVQALSPGDLADRSTLVFIASVEAQQSRFVDGPNHVVTDTTFAIERVVKGDDKHLSRYTLTQLGGVVGQGAAMRGTSVPGYARFEVGERVMLFLEPTTTGRLVPTGLAQGKFVLVTDTKTGQVMARRDLHELRFVNQSPTRHLLGVPQDPNTIKLGHLLAITRGERPVEPVPVVLPQTRQVSLPEVAR